MEFHLAGTKSDIHLMSVHRHSPDKVDDKSPIHYVSANQAARWLKVEAALILAAWLISVLLAISGGMLALLMDRGGRSIPIEQTDSGYTSECSSKSNSFELVASADRTVTLLPIRPSRAT